MTQSRTHKLQLDSVTLNFRLWDGPPSAPNSVFDTPEYTNGRPFATVEVHRLGVWIRTLNERNAGSHIHRSISPDELRYVLDDIDAAVARVQRAGLPDEYPNAAEVEAESEAEEDEEVTG